MRLPTRFVPGQGNRSPQRAGLVTRHVVLALGLSSLLVCSLACDGFESDQRKSDRKVIQALQDAEKLRDGTDDKHKTPEEKKAEADLRRLKGTPSSPEAVKAAQALYDARRIGAAKRNQDAAKLLLTTVNAEKGASGVRKIQAASRLGLTEYQIATDLARQVGELESPISRSSWEIAQAAAQIKSLSDAIAAAERTNPDPTLKAIETQRTQAQGEAKAAADKAAQLEAQIKQVNDQADAMAKQKDALVAQADADAEKASRLQGAEAAKIQDGVTEARRKAANLGHDIDKLKATLLPLERDLAAEKAKEKTANAAVAALNEDEKLAKANWEAVQKRIAGAADEKLVGYKPQIAELGKSISDTLAPALDADVKKADALRKDALEHYGAAVRQYAAAAAEATKLQAELKKWSSDEAYRTAPEAKAWKALIDLYNPNYFKTLQARAQHDMATLQAAHAEQLRNRQALVHGKDGATAQDWPSVAKILQGAGLTVPPALSADLKADVDAVAKASDDNYKKSAEMFQAVYEASSAYKALQNAAGVSQMFSAYGDYQLTGDSKQLDAAQAKFKDLFGERKNDPLLAGFPEKLRG